MRGYGVGVFRDDVAPDVLMVGRVDVHTSRVLALMGFHKHGTTGNRHIIWGLENDDAIQTTVFQKRSQRASFYKLTVCNTKDQHNEVKASCHVIGYTIIIDGPRTDGL